MAKSGAVSEWVTPIHGMSKVDIDAHSGDDNYISVQTLVEEANAEYTMLVASNRSGPQDKIFPQWWANFNGWLLWGDLTSMLK